jgi:hypothetical protein
LDITIASLAAAHLSYYVLRFERREERVRERNQREGERQKK